MNKFVFRASAALIILKSPLAGAGSTSEDFCQTQAGMSQIKAYLACQSSSAFAACAGLGATVAGRPLAQALAGETAALVTSANQSARDRLSAEIAEALAKDLQGTRPLFGTSGDPGARNPIHRLSPAQHQIERYREWIAEAEAEIRSGISRGGERLSNGDILDIQRAVKEFNESMVAMETAMNRPGTRAVLTPLFREGVDVANTPFAEWPASLRQKVGDAARTLALSMEDSTAAGSSSVLSRTKAFDEMWEGVRALYPGIDRTLDKISRHQSGPNLARLQRELAEEEAVHITRLLGKLGPVVAGARQAIRGAVGAGAGAVSAVEAMAARLGSRAPLVAGGVLGLTLATAGEVLAALPGSPAGACSDKPFGSYVNLDPSNGCQPVYQVNRQVAAVLDLPPPERQEVFNRHPEACSYYREMHRRLFAQPEFRGLQCEGRNGFVLRTFDSSSREETTYQVVLRENGHLQEVRLTRDGRAHRNFRFGNANEELLSNVSRVQPAMREYLALRMFIPDARECCASGSLRCPANFGGSPSPQPAAPATRTDTVQ